MKLVCEGDEICYRAAFACQKQAYIVTTKKGSHDFKSKYTKTDIIKHFKDKGKILDIDYTLKNYVIIEPEHIVKYTLGKMIERLWQIEVPEKITELELWLSPDDQSNFRYRLVNLMGPNGLGYKVGRGEKPHYLPFIRQLLQDKYEAKQAYGYEADDMLGICAGDGVMLSHIDKDMNMIEGWHYNHVTMESYYIEPGLGSVDIIEGKIVGRGLLFFYVQLLTGDVIDNIPGCLNEAKAHHTKPPNHTGKTAVELLRGGRTEEDAFNTVACAFQYTYKDNWLNALMECADLLWICRSKDETGHQYLKRKGYI